MQRVLFLLFVLTGCTATISAPPTTPPDLVSRIEVTGDARSVNITYEFNGGTERFEDVRLPYQRSEFISVGDRVSVFAFSADGGSLRCKWTIERAAEPIDEAEADGADMTSVSCGREWAGFTYGG